MNLVEVDLVKSSTIEKKFVIDKKDVDGKFS